jgi:hypothetical protein
VSTLRQTLAGYLPARRACGYHIDRPESCSPCSTATWKTPTLTRSPPSTRRPGRRCPGGCELACLPVHGSARVRHLTSHLRSSDTGTARKPDPGSAPPGRGHHLRPGRRRAVHPVRLRRGRCGG